MLPKVERAQWIRLSLKGVHLLIAGGNWEAQDHIVYTSVSATRILFSSLHIPKTLSGDLFQENKGKGKMANQITRSF